MNWITPELNATLNAFSAVAPVAALRAHQNRPAGALTRDDDPATFVSTIFLACYLTYHYLHGEKTRA